MWFVQWNIRQRKKISSNFKTLIDMKFIKYIDNDETIPTWDFSEEFAYFVMNDGVEGELKMNGLVFLNRDNTFEVDIHCLIFKPYKGEGIYDVDRMQEKEIEQFIIKEFNKKNSTQIDTKYYFLKPTKKY
jgi:hypothetical protein